MMKQWMLLGLLLLFSSVILARQDITSVIPNQIPSSKTADLVVTLAKPASRICSKSIQNCTLQISQTGCLNPPGSILITNNSKINARNITASSLDSNFLTYVVQNNSCPAALAPGASCSISFTTNTPIAFSLSNVTVQGSNTNATFFNMNAFQCLFTLGGTVSGLMSNGLILQNNGTNNLSVSAGASTFSFPEPIAIDSSYNVTIAQQPTGFFCNVINGSGTHVMANVSNVAIQCPTGALTPVPGSPFPTGGEPQGVAITPDSQFVYLVNFTGNTISGYSIDDTGALTDLSGSPFATGANPAAIVISPDGQFTYTVNESANTISGYTIDNAGALINPTSIGGIDNAVSIAISPNGQFAYVANFADGVTSSVSGYSIDNTGALTILPGSPFSTAIGPQAIAITPNGQFVYVGGETNSISGYSIDNTGVLTPLIGSPFTSVGGISGITISPNGQVAYVVNQSNTITSYSISSTGVLTPLGTFASGTGSSAIAITPNGSFAYTADSFSNTISGYSIDSTGALTAVPGSPFVTGELPAGIAISPNNQFVYVTNFLDDTVSAYRIN